MVLITSLRHWLHALAAGILYQHDLSLFDSGISRLNPATNLGMVLQRIQPWMVGSPLSR
jgi:hypothetical protein